MDDNKELDENENYVLNCIRSETPVRHIKYKRHLPNPNIEKIFRIAHNITEDPVCVTCGNIVKFSKISRGYKKSCSKSCWKINNNIRMCEQANINNIEKARLANEKRDSIILANSESWVYDYINTDLTISDIAKKHNDTLTNVREFLNKNGYTKKYSKLSISNTNRHINNLKYAHDKLDDVSYVASMVTEGYSGVDFANELGCSPNHVCEYLRKAGRPLINDGLISSIEKRLLKQLELYNINCVSNSRSIIAPLELDIYCPDHNIAIEVNGIYWHNADKKDKNYHLNKTKLCEDNNIQLLHVTDADLNCNSNKIISMIKSKFGIFDMKIGARKLHVVKLENKEYFDFCNENHLQNKCGAVVKLGLKDKDGLLYSIMSFSKSRYTNHQYEMIRFCNKLNSTIIGGSSKLFKYFLKEYKPESIVSYCDRKLFNGKMYFDLGFKHSHDSAPGYYWINQMGDSLSRYQTQKHKLNTTLTEDAYMKSKNYHKIFDCGQKVFTYSSI